MIDTAAANEMYHLDFWLCDPGWLFGSQQENNRRDVLPVIVRLTEYKLFYGKSIAGFFGLNASEFVDLFKN